MNFLTSNLKDCINGDVHLEEDGFAGSYTIRHYDVWYNDSPKCKNQHLKAELRQRTFRGRKFVHRKEKVDDESKKFYAFSGKRMCLMYNIESEDGTILPKDAKRLYDIFIKSGFKDFVPDEDDQRYIDGHISDGIQFKYWSDRCGYLRMKTIIEYFRRNNLISV